ncbi:MAG TPA: hypothetical protein VF062_16345 [Candidatus Limnocylindrales bacterium]
MDRWDVLEAGITYNPILAPVTIPLKLATTVIGWLVPGRIRQLLDHYRAQLVRYQPILAGEPQALKPGVDGRQALAKRVAQADAALDRSRQQVKRIWRGQAARACDKAIARLDPKLAAARKDLSNQANALSAAADGQQRAQERFNQVLTRFDAGAASLMKAAENVSSSFLKQPVEISALQQRAGELFRVAVTEAEAVKGDLGKLYNDLATKLVTGAEVAPAAPAGRANTVDDIKPDDRRQGTQSIFEQFITPKMQDEGLNAGSQLRDEATNTRVKGAKTSDHLDTNTHSYATDYPTRDGEGAARRLAESLGITNWKPNDTQRHTIEIDGHRYSAQILWGKNIDHDDHVHVGLRRVD